MGEWAKKGYWACKPAVHKRFGEHFGGEDPYMPDPYNKPK